MFHLMVLTMVMLASFLFLLVQDVFKVSGITNIKELENHMDFKFSSTGWDNWNYSNTYIFVERRAYLFVDPICNFGLNYISIY